MTKLYIEQWVPGSFVSTTYTTEIPLSERNAPKLGDRTYAYKFFERTCTVINGEELLGHPRGDSPMYYIGKELTAKEAMAQGNDIAKMNIENNGYKRLVKTKFGQMFPLKDDDVVIRG